MAIRPSARAPRAVPARTPAAPRSAPKFGPRSTPVKIKIQPEVAAAALRSLRQPVAPAPALTAPRVHAEAPAAPQRAALVAQPSRAPAAPPTPRPAAVAVATPAPAYSAVSTPAKGKKKSEEQKSVEIFGVSRKEALVSKATKKQTPSLLNKLAQPKMLCVIGALGALKVGFAVLAVKVGPLAATSLIAQHTIAFLTPGVYVTAFALEVALKLTTTIIAHGILPIVLPILSTIVVTTLAIGLTAYAAYMLLQALKQKTCALIDNYAPRMVGDCLKSMLFGDEKAKTEAPKSRVSSAISFVTNLISGSKAEEVEEVELDEDVDGSGDESSDEEVEAPSVVEQRLSQQVKDVKVATSTENRIRAELGMGRAVVRELKGFESLLEASEDLVANPHILTRFKV